MSKINIIQNAIKELEGGSFQKLFDAYLYKKYKFTNIQTLGVQDGTNKTTKGTPDSFVVEDDGKYILIMYGTVGTEAFGKMKKDILSCFNKDKLKIDDKFKKGLLLVPVSLVLWALRKIPFIGGIISIFVFLAGVGVVCTYQYDKRKEA